MTEMMHDTQESPPQFHMAPLNLARIKQPKDHWQNQGFIKNLVIVNVHAEAHSGFTWRLVGDETAQANDDSLDDPFRIANLTVLENIESFVSSVFRNKQHRAVLRCRDEWFTSLEFSLELGWIPGGRLPTLVEAQVKLALVESPGPLPATFIFKNSFPPNLTSPVMAFSSTGESEC